LLFIGDIDNFDRLDLLQISNKCFIHCPSNKCFIHCPAEAKAEAIIFSSKLQDEHKLYYTGGIIDKTMMYEAVRQMGWHDNFIWV